MAEVVIAAPLFNCVWLLYEAIYANLCQPLHLIRALSLSRKLQVQLLVRGFLDGTVGHCHGTLHNI